MWLEHVVQVLVKMMYMLIDKVLKSFEKQKSDSDR